MHTTSRYVLIILGIVISLHYLLTIVHKDYGRATSLSSLTQKFTHSSSLHDDYYAPEKEHLSSGVNTTNRSRANATFVILARNSDLDGAVRAVRSIEDRFNKDYRYPYVFLNDEPFSDDFKRRISVLSSGTIEFGLVPPEHWNQPDWIDEEKATASRNKMVEHNIIYGGSVSYRNMCRYNSGFFFKHPLVTKYRWYWRIEPHVQFHCDILYDPFLFMEENNKIYSFTITMYEYLATIPTLWQHVMDFAHDHPEYIAKDNSLGFMSSDNGKSYNLCHFWSNFEIADMDFWRGPAYTAFFEFLDSKGGFYYERWGDAPVHSMAAALFASRNQIHFFDDIGYQHDPYTHCTANNNKWRKGKCSCEPSKSFDYDGYSCMRQWDAFIA